MLPFGGQGANQGIEDGATLGVFMRGIDKTTLPARLKAYVQFRTRRVARTQLLASVRPGSESLVIERIKEFMEPGVQRKLICVAGNVSARKLMDCSSRYFSEAGSA